MRPLLHVKICGVCRPGDAALAVEAGASHVGVIRVPGSRRAGSLEEARAVVAAAAGAQAVGVFLDAPRTTVLEETDALGLAAVQLHGTEDPDEVRALSGEGLEVWKVVKPASADALLEAVDRYRDAHRILVEGHSARGHGGVGARFDWREVERALDRLAPGIRLGVGGGLTPDNVAEAVRRFRPDLVDVSSGVEAALCRKDPVKVRAFVTSAREAADRSNGDARTQQQRQRGG